VKLLVRLDTGAVLLEVERVAPTTTTVYNTLAAVDKHEDPLASLRGHLCEVLLDKRMRGSSETGSRVTSRLGRQITMFL
jgi:hypothetical protein